MPQAADDSTQERILRAATEELAEHGFAGLRTDRVAARAECNKQLIFYYFGSKAGLRSAVLERMALEALPLWERLDQVDLPEAMALNAQRYDSARDTPDYRRLLAWEGAEHVIGESEIVQEEMRSAAWHRLVRAFETAQASGRLPDDINPSVIALLFGLMAIAPTTLPQLTRLVTGLEANDARFAEDLARTIRFLGSSVLADPAPVDEPGSDRQPA
jgi:TetR/AcrR family transcriptional regulator